MSPKENEEVTAKMSHERIYWAHARGYQIDGFQKERRDHGTIVQPSKALMFTEHMFITTDPKEQGFIENSDAFKKSRIRRCKDIQEAQALTAQQNAVKGNIRTFQSAHVEGHDILDAPGTVGVVGSE